MSDINIPHRFEGRQTKPRIELRSVATKDDLIIECHSFPTKRYNNVYLLDIEVPPTPYSMAIAKAIMAPIYKGDTTNDIQVEFYKKNIPSVLIEFWEGLSVDQLNGYAYLIINSLFSFLPL